MKPIDGYKNVTDEVLHPRCQNVNFCTRDSVICINGVWLCEQCAIKAVKEEK